MAVNYLKNVMKSVTYAASDAVAEMNPAVAEFTSTNKEFATATYAAIKNPKQFVQKQVKAIQESKIYQAAEYGLKNIFEDLRTGNFYNKEREERDEARLGGLDADDWNDLDEFGIDKDWEKNLGKDEDISAGDKAVVKSIEDSNAAVASATVNAVIAASDREVSVSKTNTGVLYTQNERLFSGLHKDITVLGSTMQQMYNLQAASLQNIDKNLSDFFTNESKLSTERNAILKEMLDFSKIEEYIDGRIEGEYIVFNTSHLSQYGVIASPVVKEQMVTRVEISETNPVIANIFKISM